MADDDRTDRERQRDQRLLLARFDTWWGEQMDEEFERVRREEIDRQEEVDARRKEL